MTLKNKKILDLTSKYHLIYNKSKD